MSRDPNDLDVEVRFMYDAFMDACRRAGLDILVTCTWRSNEEQAKLYAKGRTVPGKIVTNAKPGQSLHNCTRNGRPASRAFDVVPLRDGKPIWDADDPVWEAIGEIGEGVGLEWAGRWVKMKEMPHFQKRNS